MGKIIAACVLFGLAFCAFVVSCRSFREKGFLWNNAYLYRSRQQRETMNKKPYYRQSAIVFLLVGILFLLNGLEALFASRWLAYLVWLLSFLTMVYAVVSAIRIEKAESSVQE